jgi:thioredoxin-dependent peroxiredoxin
MADTGTPAPDFTLPRDGGDSITLSALQPGKVVLYFYPKDDTPGCTTEALDFTARAADFAALGCTVIGVSKDPVKAHDKFVKKHGLGMRLCQMKTAPPARIMASGSKKACMARPTWASNARPF